MTDETQLNSHFSFGKNWSKLIGQVDSRKLQAAIVDLRSFLGQCEGREFLDIGCGSGLSSLAAYHLGAGKITSIDIDPINIENTKKLKANFDVPDSYPWTVRVGSIVSSEDVKSLPKADVVYSWGVLHHTGKMWQALENVHLPVAPGGKLFIAIYNDAGSQSARWLWLKRAYNNLPKLLRIPFALLAIAPYEAKEALRAALGKRLGEYLRSWRECDQFRGMSRWHDIVDWVGGYPYEVATPDEIFDFYRERGFTLVKLKCGGMGLGCNEFVFVKERDQ